MKTKEEIKQELEKMQGKQDSYHPRSLVETSYFQGCINMLKWVLENGKEKTFVDYVREYEKKHNKHLPCLQHYLYKKWNYEDRLGVFWHIVKDKNKNGRFFNLIELLHTILETNATTILEEDGIIGDIWEILPKEFINSIKNEEEL